MSCNVAAILQLIRVDRDMQSKFTAYICESVILDIHVMVNIDTRQIKVYTDQYHVIIR